MLSKIYLCPTDKKHSCSWEGSCNDIVDHFNEEHDDLISYSNTIRINLSYSSESYLLLFDTEIYLLQTRTMDDQLQIFLRYLGPPKMAAHLKYDISIECDNKRLDNHNIQLQDNYFAISLECIQTYFGDTAHIYCGIFIQKTLESTSSDDGVDLDDDKSINASADSVSGTLPVELDYNGLISRQTDGISIRSGSVSLPKKRLRSEADDRTTIWYQNEKEDPRSHSNLQRSSSCITSSKIRAATRTGSTLRAINETDLDVELHCSNCHEHLSLPIFLCKNRHNICQICYRDEKFCKICDKDITADRNIELEKRSEGHSYVCRYKLNGCPETHVYPNIRIHEINCMFCVYTCPMDQCGYKNSYKPMVTHLNLIHSSVKILESFIAVFAKYTELFLVNERLGIFYCSVRIVENDKVIWTAKFSGPPQRKFFCELKFKNKSIKRPTLLTKIGDHYVIELLISEMKDLKVKTKNSILTITGS